MNRYSPPAQKPANRVDWNDPQLESLLRKTESWKLDNRGAYPAGGRGMAVVESPG